MMGNASSGNHYMNGTPAVAGVSLLCMSCHDGVTALNAYSDLNTQQTYGVGVGTGSVDHPGGSSQGATLTSNAAFGNDLSNHHPIGMVWADVTANDTEIRPASTEFGNVAALAAIDGTATGITIADVLFNGKMECVTCHDVHNSQNQVGAERFLWISNNRSAFCLT